MRIYLALVAAVLTPSLAVFADEAYTVDFHYALLGLPVSPNTFFHKPLPESKASLLYTLSNKSVVGAVNPKDGAIVWRHALSLNESSAGGILRTAAGLDTVITAIDGQISCWGASEGRLSWKQAFLKSKIKSLEILPGGKASDALVLLEEASTASIKCLDAQTGNIKWEYQDDSGDVPHRLATSTTALYYVSLQPTLLKGFKIKITTIDPLTGKMTDQRTLSSETSIASADSLRFVSSTNLAPFVLWTEDSNKNLKINVLGSKHVSTFDIPDTVDPADITVHSPNGLNAAPHFLVQYQTSGLHWGELFQADLKSSSVKKISDLEKINGKGTFSVTSVGEKVFFTRATQSEIILFSSASRDVLGRWPVQKVEPNDEQLYPLHAAAEVVSRSESSFAVRSAVLLSNGDWTLIRNGESIWSRPEALSGVIKAEWADIHENEIPIDEQELETRSNLATGYFYRLKRHLQELQHFPEIVQSLPRLVMQVVPGLSAESKDGGSGGDRFGFHRLIVVATDNGRLIALDAGALGRILWNIEGVKLERGQKWNASSVGSISARIATKLEVLKSSEFLSNGTLEVLEQEAGSTTSQSGSPRPWIFKLEDGIVRGMRDGNQVWTFIPGSDQQITSITTAQINEPISSIGKVLGDRRVLYKYLSPNTALIITSHISQSSITVYLLDTTSGAILYSSHHNHVDVSRPVTSAASENWFTYSFTTEMPDDSVSRGYQIVMTELYESLIPNDRGPINSPGNVSHAPNHHTYVKERLPDAPQVVSQIYHIPEEISHMAISQTQQGITSRQLIVYLPASSAIVTIPRYVLDPRRPIGKDPTTEQMMEGLSKYSPTVEFDPSWYLNHKEEVVGIKKIIVTPALLESTGLIFAYGLDLFGTRVTPSYAFDILGKSFNKIQLILTVAALFVGTFLAAPFIQRKQTNAIWSTS